MNEQSTTAQPDFLLAAKAEAARMYLRRNSNIVGVGIGKKRVDDEWMDCVRIYVVQKQPEFKVPGGQLVAQDTWIGGVPVDVIQLGAFGRKGRPKDNRKGVNNTVTRPGSPIRVSTTLGNINEGARGTLGVLLEIDGDRYILGCNHILAVNGRVPTDQQHAAIVSVEFVGTEPKIASRCEFVPLSRNDPNRADCAIAKILDPKLVDIDFPPGAVQLESADVADPGLGKWVTKVGAGTDVTYGQIVDCDADLYVPYSFMDSALFQHQFMIESEKEGVDFAANGDSGALVVDAKSSQAVGMIFASSGHFAVATKLTTVLSEIKRELDSKKDIKQAHDMGGERHHNIKLLVKPREPSESREPREPVAVVAAPAPNQ